MFRGADREQRRGGGRFGSGPFAPVFSVGAVLAPGKS